MTGDGKVPEASASNGVLAFHQVVELPHREPAGPQQLPCVPGEAGPVDEALAVGDAEADGPADAGGGSLEREERHGFAALPDDGDPYAAPAAADGERELR